MIPCKECLYGKHLGGKDYGCRSEKRRELNRQDKTQKLVNEADYSCIFAERAYFKKG